MWIGDLAICLAMIVGTFFAERLLLIDGEVSG